VRFLSGAGFRGYWPERVCGRPAGSGFAEGGGDGGPEGFFGIDGDAGAGRATTVTVGLAFVFDAFDAMPVATTGMGDAPNTVPCAGAPGMSFSIDAVCTVVGMGVTAGGSVAAAGAELSTRLKSGSGAVVNDPLRRMYVAPPISMSPAHPMPTLSPTIQRFFDSRAP
jgi:hypothetical protein